MDATSLQLCDECTESRFSSSSQREISRFFTVSFPLPAEVPGQIAKRLCSQCKQDRETSLPMEIDPHLFDTNETLSEVEENAVGACLSEAKQELRAIDALILATEGQLQRLKDRREEVVDCVSQCSRLLSFARRLPGEVIIRIAELSAENEAERDTLNVKSGIWSLSQVCSSWRSAIVGAPLLWSNVNIRSSQPRYAVSILHESVKRSQSVALNVFFESQQTELSKLLLQMVCSQSDRWRSLELHIHPGHWSSLRQIRNTLFQLRSLKLDVMTTESLFTLKGNDFFAFAPNLANVDLGWGNLERRTCACGPPTIPLQFPEQRITSFALCVTTALSPHLANIIPRCTITLSVAIRSSQSVLLLVPTTYPSVTCLQVCRSAKLLGAFICPKLMALTFSLMRVDEDLLNHLRSFIDGPTPSRKPTSLRFCFVTCPSATLVRQVYQTVHDITRLVLYGALGDSLEDMIRLLEPLRLTTDRSRDYLPKLTVLELDFGRFQPNGSLYELIHSIVDSRVNLPDGYTGAGLSTFKFADPLSRATGTKITLNTYVYLLHLAHSRSKVEHGRVGWMIGADL